jgi:hypothetical protein
MSPVARNSFGRVQVGATKDDVVGILGQPNDDSKPLGAEGTVGGISFAIHSWSDGPNRIGVWFLDDKVSQIEIHRATILEEMRYQWTRWLTIAGL